jgi:hypothetical protein
MAGKTNYDCDRDSMKSVFLRAWLICGGLDIAYAGIVTVAQRGTLPKMLRSVASGPFGDGAAEWGMGGSLLGLATHFSIMAAMVAFFLLIVRPFRLHSIHPWLLGALYGTVLYGVMYCVVLAMRYPANFPQSDPAKIAISLFPHIFLVGIPLALIERRSRKGG